MRRAVAAGMLIGLLLTAWVAAATWDDEPAAGRPAATDAAAVRTFLAAWRRSLHATYAVDQRIERRLVDGRRITSTVRLVQRPPDRVRTGGGSVTARVAGRQVGCATGASGELRCRDGGPAPSYAAAVVGELADLRRLITGDPAPYRVTRSSQAGCWTLVLQARLLTPPYGEDATFCFDPASGAPRRALVHRAQATDVITTVALRTTVTDRDLRLPANAP